MRSKSKILELVGQKKKSTMTYLTCVIILSLQEGVYCADRRLFLSSTSTSLCDVTMKYVGHGDVCDVCGDVCGRGAVKVRILFERDRCERKDVVKRCNVGSDSTVNDTTICLMLALPLNR